MFANGGFQMIEVLAPGISFITQHHTGPLPIAHRAGAAVCEQVDIDNPRSAAGTCLTCGGDGPLSLSARGQS